MGKAKTAAVVSINTPRSQSTSPRLRALCEAATKSVAGAWELFLETDFRALRVSSRKDYATVAKRAMRDLPARPVAADMASWLAGLEESGLARATRRKYQVIVSDVFDCVATYTNDATFHNELRKVPKPKQRARRRRFPPTEIIHFLGTVAACTLPERVAVRLCAYVGMRIGEVLALRHKDVFEMPSGVVLNVEFTRDRYGLRPRKNSDSERMHQPTLDAETANLVLQLRATPGEYLLPWKHSTPTAVIRRWRRTFPQIAESMPAGDGWHILRHWGATTVASLPGACEVDVQAWLGNSTSAAAQTYMNQVRGTTRNASAAHIVRAVGPPPPLQLGLGLGGATGPPGAGTSAAMGTPIPMAARTDSSSHFSNQNFNQKGKNHD